MTTSMFDSIKNALQEKKNSNVNYADYLKTEVGGSYKVRLLPNKNDLPQSIVEYAQFGWNSLATNEYVSFVSPLSFDKNSRDPIHELRVKLYRGSPEDQEVAKKIKRLNKYLVNVYVEEDSSNPDNEGTVKVLRYGTQLHNIIEAATIGDDSDDYGVERVFNLGEDGVSLKIRVTEQGGYPNYTTSKFTLPHAIEGMTESKQEQVLDQTFDLVGLLNVKSFEELQEAARVHILCEGGMTTPKQASTPAPQPKQSAPKVSEEKKSEPAASNDNFDDIDIDELISGLDD